VENIPQARNHRIKRNILLLEVAVSIAALLAIILLVDVPTLILLTILLIIYIIIIIIIIQYEKQRNEGQSKRYPFSVTRSNRTVEARLEVGEAEVHDMRLSLHRFTKNGSLKVDGIETRTFQGWSLMKGMDDVSLEIGTTEKHRVVIKEIGSTRITILVDDDQPFSFDIY
jgi:Ca2+/Na+ antiporter